MKLYHGTYVDFYEIDFSKTIPFKDFGQGFYLTDILSQAKEMAVKKARLFKGEPVVQVYEFDEKVLESGDLKVKRFVKPDESWAEFIYKNRNRQEHFSHDYDIVIGPIANDGIAYLLDRYEEGTIASFSELAKELEFKNLNNQYFFGTSKALQYLVRL